MLTNVYMKTSSFRPRTCLFCRPDVGMCIGIYVGIYVGADVGIYVGADVSMSICR